MHGLREEWRQFRLLARSGSFRLLDSEMLSPGGDMSASAANVLAVLVAFGMALSLMLLYKYVFHLPPAFTVAVGAITWPDKQYLLAASMLASGFVLVMTWDRLFPDRRDAMMFCPLPVHLRTHFAVRLAGMAGMLFAVVVAANIVSFVAFPTYMMSTEQPRISWTVYAWIHARTVFAASAFTFFALLALEGALLLLLPYRLFQRLSAAVQLLLLFGMLFLFVLEPNVTPMMMANPLNATLVRLLPPVWFLALYQQALGSTLPVVQELAELAKSAIALAVFAALATYTLGYRKAVRQALEEADAVPAARGAGFGRLSGALLRRVAGTGVRGAVFGFVARTMVRHRRNRLILAVYLSLALGYTLGDVARLVRDGGRQLYTPSAGLAAVSLVLLFFTLLGMRVLFTIPVELKANWIFRLTECADFALYRAAVRRVMLWLGAAPVCVLALAAHTALWGWRYALLHVAMLLLVALLLVEILLGGFAKIPFTCSFLPGRAELKTRLGVWAIVFSLGTALVTNLEAAMLVRPRGYVFCYALGCAVLAWMVRERRRFEREQWGVVYEDRGEFLVGLGLRT